MRKRFVTTLAACLLSAVCVFGAAACNTKTEGGFDAGTEAEWNAAFAATLGSATNLTAKVEGEATRTTFNDGLPLEENSNATASLYANESGCIGKVLSTGAVGEETRTEYIDSFMVIDGNNMWSAGRIYNSPDEEATKSLGVSGEKFDSKAVLTAVYRRGIIDMLYSSDYKMTIEDGNGKNEVTVPELYSLFTYKDGKYSADLRIYNGARYAIYNGLHFVITYVNIQADVTIKDGYVVEMSETYKNCEYRFVNGWSDEEIPEEELVKYYPEFKDFKFKCEGTLKLTLSDFGKTTVTMPDDVLAAIEAEKAKNPDTPDLDTPDISEPSVEAGMVTEDGWEAAFKATFNSLTNVTVKVEGESRITETRENEQINKVSGQRNIITLCSNDNGFIYKDTSTQIGVENAPVTMYDRYEVVDGDYLFWVIQDYSSNGEAKEQTCYAKKFNSKDRLNEEYNRQIFNQLLLLYNFMINDGEDEKEVTLPEMYSLFTYADGKYSAKVKMYGVSMTTFNNYLNLPKNVAIQWHSMDILLDVVIKDGYVVEICENLVSQEYDFKISELNGGWKIVSKEEFVALYPEFNDIAYKLENPIKYTFSDFGKTTVTMPDDVLAAIEDKKTES